MESGVKLNKLTLLYFIFVFISFTQVSIYVGGVQISSYLPVLILLLLVVFAIYALSPLPIINCPAFGYIVIGLNSLSLILYFFNVDTHLTFLNLRLLFLVNLYILAAYLFVSHALYNKDLLVKSLNYYVLLNVSCLLLQLFTYHVLNFELDIHSILLPFSRVVESSVSWGVYRPKGLQLEPGTYALAIITSLVISFAITKRVTVLSAIAALSVILTYSVSGIISAVLFLFVSSFLKSSNTRKVVSIIILLSIAVLLIPFVLDYIDTRYLDRAVMTDHSSDGLKLLYLKTYLSFDISRILLGSGFRLDDTGIDSFLVSLGPVFNIIFFFGLSGVFCILFLLKTFRGFLGLLFLVFLSQKIGIERIHVWIVILIFLNLARYEKV
ncbi:hypothetical protein BCT05_06865 [Vibrio breoganii]|nr:hypothetical protein BCT05_06865 [Vibrio breoganii]